MTIRIYPSRLPGEPLETHEHSAMTLHDWFMKNVRGWQFEMTQPVAVDVDGIPVPQSQWPLCVIKPGDNVHIYPIPGSGIELGVVGWIAVAVAAVSVAYALFMMNNMNTSGYTQSGNGDQLELNPAKANSAKLGDPIREIFGRYKVWPDYVVQPVSRFVEKKKYVTHMLLCVGVGEHIITRSNIKIGATPISSFGDDVAYTIYPPGADVSADERSENWYNSSEVGGTNAGTAGLDLGSSGPETTSVNADAVTVSDTSITLVGETSSDDEDSDDSVIPESWTEGMIIYVRAPNDYTVGTVGGYSVISGALEELAPYVGMPVILDFNDKDYSLFIASYTPAEDADPEDPDSVATVAKMTLAYISANGTPFTGIPDGSQRLTLGTSDFRYKITEIDGLTISVVRVKDVTTTTEDDEGNTTSTTTTVVDPSWTGFTERTMLDASVTGVGDDYNWLGPYMACPDSETTTRFEINFAFTSGLCSYDNKGNKGGAAVTIAIQWRAVDDDDWNEKVIRYSDSSEDAVGFTEVFDVETAAQIEVRVRRTTATAGGSTRDLVYWQALRSRLSKRPKSYADVTTIALTVRTGNRIAAQSDRRVNIVSTRQYDGHVNRSISGALYHVLDSLGIAADTDAIDALEENYWTPRGEKFDFEANESNKSALDILQTITNAGMGYFLLSDGLASAGREGIKPWTGVITPQEMTEPMQTAFSAPSEDDYDGVDVTYIDGTTWAEETVQCRTEDNPTPRKVEDYTLDGVLDQDRAYRIGMRRLMAYRHQRLTHTTTTEMDALCYEYKDRIIFTDDIPGTNTISCLIVKMHYDDEVITLEVSEPLDWTFTNPRALIRHQDGSASALLAPTRIDDYTMTVPNSEALSPESWIMDDPYIEPPRLVFCSSERVGYDALMDSIEPNTDGTCGVTAKQYTPLLYQYDDATYPGDTDNTSDD